MRVPTRLQLTAAAVTPLAGHAARQAAEAADALAGEADVESVEKVIFEEKKEKAENYNLYIKSDLQKESFCENDDLGTYSTDSLGVFLVQIVGRMELLFR